MKYETRTITKYAIPCSRCGKRGPWELTREDARAAAEANGWILKDGEAICPVCYDDLGKNGAGAELVGP